MLERDLPAGHARGVRQQVADLDVLLAVLRRTPASTTTTGAKASMAPRSIATRPASAVSVLVHEKKLTIVFSPHGIVFARSACPPQMSATNSPSMSTAIAGTEFLAPW